MLKPIGILGGTFDPIHHGHLRVAIECLETLDLAEVRLIPAHIPPHRVAPRVTSALRLAMVEAAIAGASGLIADPRELQRSGNSYTVETLRELRQEQGQTPLCLILGMDAFRLLHTWYQWERLVEFAHIVVVHRPETEPPQHEAVLRLLSSHQTDTAANLHTRPAGLILLHTIPLLAISSTQIRNLIFSKRNPRYLVPEGVLELMQQHHLYQSDERYDA